jgi:TonB family protein
MHESSAFTFREAVLSSLLLHASIFIVLVLFPQTFATTRSALEPPIDPNAPIPLEFLSEPPPAPEPMVMADAGVIDSSDPRPESAPPPDADDPFSIGNTPNRFLAPPNPAPPSPQAGIPEPIPAEEETPAMRDDASGEKVGDSGDVSDDTSDLTESDPATDGFVRGGAKAREGDGEGTREAGSLREALGRLSSGISGGAPLRFDNPVGGLSGPSGGLSFDTKGFNWGPYARRIYWIIWTNWTQGWPPAARAGLAGVVTVRFRIHGDGTISGIHVVDPSGTPAFDTCATVALEASSPLPPLPSEFPGDSEGITAQFLYNMRAP